MTESPLPEDMSKEHIYNHSQYVWDMALIKLFREGKMKEAIDIMPEFTEQTIAETEGGDHMDDGCHGHARLPC